MFLYLNSLNLPEHPMETWATEKEREKRGYGYRIGAKVSKKCLVLFTLLLETGLGSPRGVVTVTWPTAYLKLVQVLFRRVPTCSRATEEFGSPIERRVSVHALKLCVLPNAWSRNGLCVPETKTTHMGECHRSTESRSARISYLQPLCRLPL